MLLFSDVVVNVITVKQPSYHGSLGVGFLVVLAFLVLFVLGFPVVLAIGIPCVVYIFAKDLPVDLIAQRTLYALDSFPLVAVPVFLFVGSLMNSAGISRYIYRFADTAVEFLFVERAYFDDRAGRNIQYLLTDGVCLVLTGTRKRGRCAGAKQQVDEDERGNLSYHKTASS